MRLLRSLLPVLALGAFTACTSVREGVSATLTQMGDWSAWQDAAALRAAPDTPARLRAALDMAAGVCAFARADLGVACGDNYVKYVELGRPAERWMLVAAPEAVAALRSGCTIAGDCAGRALFASRVAAEATAEDLRQRGLDVDVKPLAGLVRSAGGAELLSSIVAWPDFDLAYRMLYELAMQSVATAGDDAFAGAFADVFARAGTRRWLAREAPGRLPDYLELEARRETLVQRLGLWRAELTDALSSGASPAGRRARKQEILRAMQDELLAQPAEVLGGRMELERLRGVALNNAHVAGLDLPGAWTGRFAERLQRLGGDPQLLLVVAREVAQLPPSERQAALKGREVAAR